MYIPRALELRNLVEKKSCFLFGPRQTGKSSLIQHLFPDVKQYNLLDSAVFLRFSQNLKCLEQEITDSDRIIIIDEIQRLPELLNEVHLLIESKGIHFLLTGSSARKLRRGGVNLLGGRARSRYLHPFCVQELGDLFEMQKALQYGLIPSIYLSDEPLEDLKSYAGDYLREEIASEALVRNVSAFSRFLHVAAFCNAQMINFNNISHDAQVPRSTVVEYFQILEDTLLAFHIQAWKKTVKRKPITTSKFYFFDVGLVRFLQNRRHLALKTPEFGEAFETFIAHELKCYCDNGSGPNALHYWRSSSGFEVDFILNEHVAIEVKAKEIVGPKDLRSLKALKEEALLKHYILICFEARERLVDGIHVLPWTLFLEKLYGGEYQC